MENLIFDQLLVKSNTLESANQFKFSKTLNLITANDNSVGKTTLVKLLYWTFGCDVSFDTTWNNFDCQTVLVFFIGNSKYIISRYNNSFVIKSGSETFSYSKITGDYSKKIAEILKFNLLLPNRSSSKLEIPPPAYYFLPYYIDQKKSWSKALNNFESLGQYSSWQSNTLKYHVGLITDEYFEIEKEVVTKKIKKNEHAEKIDTYTSTIEIIETLLPKNKTILKEDDLNIQTNELKQEIESLTIKQEELFTKISDYQNEMSFLLQQENITKTIIEELEKDYKFTIENIENDIIECPLCGVQHKNTIIERSSILSDKNNSTQQLETIQSKIASLDSKISNLVNNKKSIVEKINNINREYESLNSNNTDSIDTYFKQIASNTVQDGVQEKIHDESNEIVTLDESIKEKKKEQNKLLTKEEKKSIYDDFIAYFIDYLSVLEVKNINLAKISKPTDYSVIQKEGGAAEGARAMLAYYMSIYTCIKEKKDMIIAPLTIDTPNQHEQSDLNYSNIVDLILKTSDSSNQIFLCAMKNKELGKFEEKAKVFDIKKENKILSKEMFKQVNNEIDMHNIEFKTE